MSNSDSKRASDSDKTPSGQTRPPGGEVNDGFKSPQQDNSPIPDLATGAVLCNRYRINHSLGKGGFGGVYLAFDLDLNRKVAIKRQIGRHLDDTELARNEAKFIAGLDHPSIVKVYDLVDDKQEGVLIIMEYVSGFTLHEFLRRQKLSFSRAISLAIEIAEALVHAHSRRIVHRDLKPSNVLLDQAEKVKLSDFGLALGAINLETAPSGAGTPKYMAPEQVRAESHRIDGRTDLWALGVMLYEMLSGGTLPFFGASRTAIFEAILHDEPTPLRQLNPRIPEEVERVVDRCMRKRMSERPVSAADLLDDLKACHALVQEMEVESVVMTPGQATAVDAIDSRTPKTGPSSSHARPLRVEPKGLRPYTEEDGVHFLDLIPGPRERSGLPESIHFWKKWASCDNVDEYASVGVLYGPSGAGKTSFVRAGLINQLSHDICPIVIECRTGDLAKRIESAIRARFHQKSHSGSLSNLLNGLRKEEGGVIGYRKILIILDQFETWSTSATTEERRSLAEALRHCDGKTLQSLFVVRDDYWSGISETMQWIDVPLVENRNVRSLELLDPRHAQRVLEGMGRAHGTLPRAPEVLSSEQQLFIRQAVDGLAKNDRVVAVHLVMFAQIVRVIPWTPQMLRKQGGVEGACASYLHEIFETSSGPPAYRRISGVVADILNELLPAQGDPLKASAKSLDELRSRVLGASSGSKCTEAVRILSEDLKLITPTHSEGDTDSLPAGAEGYQLAHDFLVEPVRNWVELARKSTWRGRAVARLVELSELWQRKPQKQFLPTFREYAAMQMVVPSSSRNDKQKKYLRAAGRYHAGRVAATTVATIAAVIFAVLAIDQYSKRADAERLAFAAKANLLVFGEVKQVPRLLDELGRNPRNLSIVEALLNSSTEARVRLRAGMLAVRLGKSTFHSVAGALEDAEAELFPSILPLCETDEAKAALNAVCADSKAPQSRKARAAILLLYVGINEPVREMLRLTNDCTASDSVVIEAAHWRGDAQPWIGLLAFPEEIGSAYYAMAVLSYFSSSDLGGSFPWAKVEAYRWGVNSTLASAAECLLRLNGKNLSLKKEGRSENAQRVISRMGVELLSLAPGVNSHPDAQGNPQAIELKEQLWVSINPIERRLYDQFKSDVENKSIDGTTFPDFAHMNTLPDSILNHPNRSICGIDISQAVQCCNWLSKKEGLTPAYIYEGKQSFSTMAARTFEYDKWKRDLTANGYRLPTRDEFKYIAYAGVEKGIPWRVADKIELQRLAVAEVEPFTNKRLSREAWPNRLGIFCYDTNFSYWFETDTLLPRSILFSNRGFSDFPSAIPGPSPICILIVVRKWEKAR